MENKCIEILVVQPDDYGPLAKFGEYFDEAGIRVTLVQPFLGDIVPDHLEADGLVVLGGEMDAYADKPYPWLNRIRELYRQADEASIPALGICLGAQLLAVTFGGEVTVNDKAGPEVGVVEVNWLKAAQGDELVGGLPSPFLTGAFHHDGITSLPREAIRLGTGEKYPNQAFRVRNAVGIQFHPEVTSTEFREWCTADLHGSLLSDAQLGDEMSKFERLDPIIIRHTKILADNFVDSIWNSKKKREKNYNSRLYTP